MLQYSGVTWVLWENARMKGQLSSPPHNQSHWLPDYGWRMPQPITPVYLSTQRLRI